MDLRKKIQEKGDKKITNSFIYSANAHLKALMAYNSKETTDFMAQRQPEEGGWADGRYDWTKKKSLAAEVSMWQEGGCRY